MAKPKKSAKKKRYLPHQVMIRISEDDLALVERVKYKNGLETVASALRFCLRYTAEGQQLANVGEGFAPQQIEPRSTAGTSLRA